ncbi:MAG: ferredoxin-nitrite reductase [Gaiellales bacterium]|nr:ferredoxin-nitrite reductase [Gaiellales bacterium]
MTDTAAKLPEIEHIKSRKNGLDVLADIYRYAELGFEAIEPDDLALFRWYGVYTQRAEESAASGDPGPSEQTDGLFMLRIKFPNGIVNAEQLRTIGSLAERYGRSMGDITTRQNIQLHNLTIADMPLVLDELTAVGLSFTQACGDVWRNVVGCPLAGVDGHELIDSRPLVAELERTFVGNREFANLPRKF